MARARAGDRSALDSLLRRHYDRLYVLCRRLTGNDADAADACQEALVAVVRGLPSFDGRSAFGTWAYRVTTNACLDELRRRQRRPQPGLPEGLELASTIDGQAAAGDRLDIDAALARIPTDYRVAVVLRDVCDLSYEQISELLAVPPGTVRSRIARGRAALAPLLGAARPGHQPGGGNRSPRPRRQTPQE